MTDGKSRRKSASTTSESGVPFHPTRASLGRVQGGIILVPIRGETEQFLLILAYSRPYSLLISRKDVLLCRTNLCKIVGVWSSCYMHKAGAG